MSIIEQAAKRLEELKRAGIEVPASVGLPTSLSPTPAATPPVEVKVSPISKAQANVSTSNRRSREIHLDLARLEREGYLVPSQARSLLAEQMRIIKRPLLANARGETAQPISRGNLVMVASAMPGEGKTFFSMNLAMSIAMEVDHSVLLVDADVLRPSVLARYGIDPSRGLMDAVGSSQLDLSDVMLRTNVPKLSILPAGTANAKSTELLASGAMEHLLDELASKYSDRIVIFDAPPLIPTTESRVLASRVGQVVMVVEAGRTTHAQVAQAYSAVEACPVVLSVLNKASGVGASESYGYYYAA